MILLDEWVRQFETIVVSQFVLTDYSPDLAFSDFHIFATTENSILADNELQYSVENWLIVCTRLRQMSKSERRLCRANTFDFHRGINYATDRTSCRICYQANPTSG